MISPDNHPPLKRGMIIRFDQPIPFGSFKERVFQVLDGVSYRFLAGGEGGTPCKILSAVLATVPFVIEQDPTAKAPVPESALVRPGEQLSLF